MNGVLYLVATPIGNLGDITLRALETLKSVDIIACEDTRRTLKLLNKFQIKKPLISYYMHKEQEGSESIIGLLKQGKNIALVSDAGMPCISDPGSILVQKLIQQSIDYTVIPGASAAICAVALTGVCGSFSFLGFLPEKNKAKLDFLQGYKELYSNLIFYSAPHDVNKDLDYLYSYFGERTVFLVKEITKIHETILKGSLSNLRVEKAQGEFVIIIEKKQCDIKEISSQKIGDELKFLITSGVDKKTAIKTVATLLKVPKNRVYEIAIKL